MRIEDKKKTPQDSAWHVKLRDWERRRGRGCRSPARTMSVPCSSAQRVSRPPSPPPPTLYLSFSRADQVLRKPTQHNLPQNRGRGRQTRGRQGASRKYIFSDSIDGGAAPAPSRLPGGASTRGALSRIAPLSAPCRIARWPPGCRSSRRGRCLTTAARRRRRSWHRSSHRPGSCESPAGLWTAPWCARTKTIGSTTGMHARKFVFHVCFSRAVSLQPVSGSGGGRSGFESRRKHQQQ